jgi:hypothetical protein
MSSGIDRYKSYLSPGPLVDVVGSAGMYEHRRANPFRRVVRVTAAWPPLSFFYARTLHHIDQLVFRFTRGRATFASWVAGLPIVMLTTTGAKSGRRNTLRPGTQSGLVPQPLREPQCNGLLRGRHP